MKFSIIPTNSQLVSWRIVLVHPPCGDGAMQNSKKENLRILGSEL